MRTTPTTVMCASTHQCNGGREGRCTRLLHASRHYCFWCGHGWADPEAKS